MIPTFGVENWLLSGQICKKSKNQKTQSRLLKFDYVQGVQKNHILYSVSLITQAMSILWPIDEI